MVIYHQEGSILRSRMSTSMSWYCSRFKRESDLITYVTIARHTYKYHLTNIHARILTFYEEKVAYIIDMDIVDISESAIITQKGNYYEHDYLIDIIKPDGIDVLRFMDEPICFEAFYTTKLIFENIKQKQSIIDIFDKLDIPNDVANVIYERNIINIKDIINLQSIRPFKVQGNKHGYKTASYRIVEKEDGDDFENSWYDVSESD